MVQLEFVDVDDELVRLAGDLAESHVLRAYDAVHLAAALSVAGQDLAVVAGDRALLIAAEAIGLAVAAVACTGAMATDVGDIDAVRVSGVLGKCHPN